jgi:glucosamine--fructose-6-phosphate aminotransferase (isomerizing)
MPAVRPGPPYAMTEMIAAEPAFAERLLDRLLQVDSPARALAGLIRATAAAGRHVDVVGCGTSEHGAIGAAAILGEAVARAGLAAAGDIRSVQAFEAALAPQEAGLVVAISHEGGTWATNEALSAAHGAGVPTALITVSNRSPGAALADVVVTTDEADQSWCHTIGYLSPLLAATAIGSWLSGAPLEPALVRGLIERAAAQPAAAEAIAAGLAVTSRLVVLASGADRPAARELALKVEEASYLPAVMRDLETMLHGHLPATDATAGLVLILTDREGRAARSQRAQGALAAARLIGLPTAAIVADDAPAGWPADLASLGLLMVGAAPSLPAPVAALLGSAAPVQLLTERLARARGTNPDTLRRTDPRYVAAAAVVE